MSVLGQARLFSGMLSEELHSLAQTAEMRSYPAGCIIFQEGDPGDGMFVVVEGLVQVSALVSDGQRRVLTRVKPGDFFGEMAVLDDEPRSATATAETETKAIFIQRDDLMRVLEHSPKLAVSLMREFSRRMRDSNRHYVQEVLQAERLTLVGRFARSIVHDFKNPLNIIGLAAEMMGMDKATPDMRVSAQKRIRKQVDRLGNMINELLEFTRGSQTSSVLAETDYATFIRPLIEDLRLEVAARSVSIEMPGPPPEVTLLLDQQRLS
ncbi:MAG: cyclic nucleotide-binding domain-containing protein, partial [Pedosphaera parvula]|nr:cyclic nucleotide-binding domain-containing protein [Pedosphaera parvula]